MYGLQIRSWAPHTGRGSDSLVLIEAGGFYPMFYGIPIKMAVTKFFNLLLKVST